MGAYTEGPAKSERSRRVITLPPSIVTLLKRQSANVAAERLRFGPAWQDDYVFPREGGGPATEHAIRLALDRGLAKAKITEHVKIHGLRHTAISALLAAGGSLQDAQALAGHVSISLTADTYGHFAPSQRQATANRIETALGAAIVGA